MFAGVAGRGPRNSGMGAPLARTPLGVEPPAFSSLRHARRSGEDAGRVETSEPDVQHGYQGSSVPIQLAARGHHERYARTALDQGDHRHKCKNWTAFTIVTRRTVHQASSKCVSN